MRWLLEYVACTNTGTGTSTGIVTTTRTGITMRTRK